MSNNTSNKPAAKLTDGRLKATIWRNAGEKGTFHSVDFTRIYKDANGEWQDSTSFSGTELLRLSHLAAKAYDKLAELRTPDDPAKSKLAFSVATMARSNKPISRGARR